METFQDTEESRDSDEVLYEQINRRIEIQERIIRLLSAQIRYSILLKEASNSIECLVELNETQKLDIEQNERTLEEYDKILSEKRCYFDKLQNDLHKEDDELINIQFGSCNRGIHSAAVLVDILDTLV